MCCLWKWYQIQTALKFFNTRKSFFISCNLYLSYNMAEIQMSPQNDLLFQDNLQVKLSPCTSYESQAGVLYNGFRCQTIADVSSSSQKNCCPEGMF